ncbi:Nif11-like leader peptide family natural product precursor [Synechococcus sp. M16CYN]|uniref:Nif11-like leader peptide family natural product precursor n=1 Tax=Synechococcus sp. M16CYN TaxID=3103139 RepID=UPI00324C4DB4
MVNNDLSSFVNSVVRFHELAKGLKSLKDHDEIIAYGQSHGFQFTKSDWELFYQTDLSLQSNSVRRKILLANPAHWSWAFRQLSTWRAMLMEGADDGNASI